MSENNNTILEEGSQIFEIKYLKIMLQISSLKLKHYKVAIAMILACIFSEVLVKVTHIHRENQEKILVWKQSPFCQKNVNSLRFSKAETSNTRSTGITYFHLIAILKKTGLHSFDYY